MSFDLMVYIVPPLPEVIDQWEAKYAQLGEGERFDPEARTEIKQRGTFGGFFPVGEQGGFELFMRIPEQEELHYDDSPPQLANTRYVLTLSMHSQDLPVGFLCAGTLGMVGKRVIYEPQAGVYLTPEQAIAQGREMLKG